MKIVFLFIWFRPDGP